MAGADEHGRPEPAPAAGEAETVLGFLEFHRATLAWKCRGRWPSAVSTGWPRAWSDGRTPNLRWIMVHLVEEYPRHNGHADLLRESVEGLTGE